MHFGNLTKDGEKMDEKIFEFLNDYGFLAEELLAFNSINEKLFFASLKNITDNIAFLEAKGLSRKEIINIIRKNPFMLTVSTKKKELLDELYKGIFSDEEIKEIIVKYPDMYIVSLLELKDVIEYLERRNLNPREVIINNLNVLSFDLEDIKNEVTKIAYAEVLEILNYVDSSLVAKIPVGVLEYFEEASKKDISVNIDKEDIFNKNNISRDALALLAYIDMEYWANKEERREFKKTYMKNEWEEKGFRLVK